jgi:hypothetical protein
VGQMVKQVSEHTTRYYWYPGDKRDWIRAAIAVGVGLTVLVIVSAVTRGPLPAVVSGASTTAAFGGVNLGRRDARALVDFADLGAKAVRRRAIEHSGPAAWRAVVAGIGGASAAVLIVNLPARGLLADWLLPLVPAVVGALAHQGGMLYERMGYASPRASSRRPVLKPATKPT